MGWLDQSSLLSVTTVSSTAMYRMMSIRSMTPVGGVVYFSLAGEVGQDYIVELVGLQAILKKYDVFFQPEGRVY